MNDDELSQPDHVAEYKMLDSGYWYVRWNREAWAQWPRQRYATREDFFHADFSYTPQRQAFCDALMVKA